MSHTKIGTLVSPPLFDHIPTHAQWLGGIGAGTWFVLSKEIGFLPNEFRVRRYSSEGELECDRIFTILTECEFNINESYQFTYISHCQSCKIIQRGKVYNFEYKKSFFI